MPLIFPSNTLSGGYTVDNSCRFNDGDSDYLDKTFASSGTSDKIFTTSVWLKRSELGAEQGIFTAGTSQREFIRFESDGTLTYRRAAGTTFQLTTSQVFRDPSAFYHIIIAVDTTQGTASNRVKFYVNGSQITSFGTETYPAQNYLPKIGGGQTHNIGRDSEQSTPYYDGYMAEFVFIDGQQLTPTSFGEFDSASPTIWKPIDVSELTFGTNGFYLDFEDSADLGDDESGNTNDFTETNLAATDQASDSPTNNFATMNPLVVINGSTFSEGNCKIVTGSSPYSYDVSTIGVANGKWYVEAKYGGSSDDATFGIAGRTATDTTHELGNYNDTWSYYTGTGASNIRNNNSNSSYGATYTTNDIIGLALDLTNNKLYFSKNGAWQNSGDPESGATGTGAVDITAASSVTDGVYYIAVGDYDGGASVTWEINFGNPSYTGTDQDDDNGYGSFEYDPPSGYLALCTKNLGSDGG